MPTCPFCAGDLTRTERDRFACPAGGSRFEQQADHWYLLRDDGPPICVRTTRPDPAAAMCAECAHPDAERICLHEHLDAGGHVLALFDRPTLARADGVERLVIEGVRVELEVSHHRCDVHGDDGQPHRVVRRDVGQ